MIKHPVRIAVSLSAFAILTLLFQNCGEVSLLAGHKIANSAVDDETPSPPLPVDDGLVYPKYTPPPGNFPNRAESGGLAAELADNECVSHSMNGSLPSNNIYLSREKDPKSENCPSFDRAPYELVNGCRVYTKESIDQWISSKGLFPWVSTPNGNYVTDSFPYVVQQPFETVSIKFSAETILKSTNQPGYSAPVIRGGISIGAQEGGPQLISITTEPCEFRKVSSLPKHFCQKFSRELRFATEDSDSVFLADVQNHEAYSDFCLLESASDYYVNVRMVAPSQLEVPTASTCQHQWCGYFFDFQTSF